MTAELAWRHPGRGPARTDVRWGSALGPVPRRDWDELLAGQRFYSSSAWLRFCATDPSADSGVVVVTDVEGLSAAPLARFEQPPSPLYRWAELLTEQRLPVLPGWGVMIGPRQGYQGHLLTSAAAGVVGRAERLLVGLRADYAARGGTGALVGMYLTSDDVRTLRAAGVSALPVFLELDAEFALPAGGWHEWLDSLSAKRRRKIQAEVRAFESVGYVVEHGQFSDVYRELGRPASATLGKYGRVADPETWIGVMKSHADQLGGAAKVVTCRRDGVPVGFCLYFVWGGCSFLRWAGFDYENVAGRGEYVNVTYYEQFRHAAEQGIDRVHAGLKSSELKALRGARLRPLWLLDLVESSRHAAAEREIRAHNRRRLDELRADPRVSPALTELDHWLEWC